MAQCKDCIHGEICDMFAHTRTLICTDRADKMCKMFKSTADVVPKSEVDDLEYALTGEVNSLEYTLEGVMHSVDKWLEGDELRQDEVNRAATMREKILRIVERLQEALSKAEAEVAREIFEEIEEACVVRFGNSRMFSEENFAELKKKYTEEKT